MPRTEIILLAFSLLLKVGFGQAWQKMDEFPGADRDDALALSNQEKAIFFSGNIAGSSSSNTVFLYHIDSNAWRTTADFPGMVRQYAGGFVIDDTAYVVGGFSITSGLSDFWTFDFKSETWTQKTDLPFSERWSFAGFSVLGQGYVVGGTNGSERNAEVWRYDPPTSTWTQLADFPGGPRRELVSAVSRNRAYIGLGYDDFSNGEFFNDWWKFETINETWTQMPNYPVDALGWAEAIGGTSYCIVVGGSGVSGTFTNESFWYNVADESWVESPKMLLEGYRGCSSFESGSHVYALSGLLENIGRQTELYRLDYPEQTKYKPFAFPNPANGVSRVFVPEFSTLTLFDVHGKKLETHQTNEAGYLTLTNHRPGLYYYQVSSDYTISPMIPLVFY